MMSAPDAGTPWYRQPMVLMVIAIPAIAVVVSFTMLAISIKTFDGVVVDDYYRQGKEINQTLHRDKTAARLGIVANIRFLGDEVNVSLQAAEAVDWPDLIPLRILHPTQAGRDAVIDLLRQQSNQYWAKLPDFKPGEWILQLDTELWRLNNRARLDNQTALQLDSSGITLKP